MNSMLTDFFASNTGKWLFMIALGAVAFVPFRNVGLRKGAWIKIFLGLLFAMVVIKFIPHPLEGKQERIFMWMIALPLVYAATGAIEFVTCKPFLKEAQKFDSLNTDRKYALGFWAVVITLAMAFFAGYIYIHFS